MARGFLSGAIWGTVLSMGGVATLSVLSPMPPQSGAPAVETALPEDVAPEAQPETAEPEAATSDRPAEAEPVEVEPAAVEDEPAPEPEPEPEALSPTTGGAESAPAPARVAEPESQPGRRPADVAGLDPDTDAPGLSAPSAGADRTPDTLAAAPTPVPETGDTVAGLEAPQGPEASGVEIEAGDAAPQAPSPAPALNAPQGEIGLSVSTEPAQPPAPAIPEAQTALVPDPQPVPEETPVAETPAQETAPEEAAPEQSAPEQEADAETPPERPTVRRLVPDADGLGEGETAGLSRPAIGTPASSLAERSGSSSSRLPSIGDTAEPAEPPMATEALPPLERFAVAVDADRSLPRLAIVLIDDGTGPLGPDTLDNFPFPVTFALDPAKAGAAERMAAYRAQGFEVAALADLPEAAEPSDVEQILAGTIAAVPEAVALIEAPGSAVQANRSSTEQLASFAAESGHGLVFLPNGLNTAEAMARRDNVAAVSVLRDFDGEGQDARTKRRFLDGGAFRARQDGSAVMLGRLTPDTLSALLLWSLQDRASSVAMVPVSDLLRESLN